MKNALIKYKRLWLFITLFLVCNVFLFSSFKPSAEITIGTKGQNTIVNFFYDNLADGYPFDDSHMIPDISLPEEGLHKLNVPMPSKYMNKLRIDFGKVPNFFEVYSFSVLKSPVYEIKISGEEFLTRFSNTNDINEYAVKDGIVRIHTSGTDGHIYSLNLLKNAPMTIRKDFLQQELLFAILSFVLIFIEKFLLLKKSCIMLHISKLRMLTNKISIYHICIILIFLFALILRFNVANTTREFILGSDESTYHYAAENLLKYGTLTYDRNGTIFNGTQDLQPTTVLSPGYPIYISVIYALFHHSKQALLISQLILSMVCLWLIYKMLRMLKVKKPYIAVTLLIAAVYPGFLYNIDRMLTEQLFTTLLLAFVYSFLKGLQENKFFLIGISAVYLVLATHVRALAFPFVLIAISFLIVYERKDKKQMLKKIVVLTGIIFLGMLPWWIRNWITFDNFMLFSEAGENPKIWGAVPYFIDMASTENQTLINVLNNNITPNPSLYFKWRVFGFFQYMWGDLWDENLVHPYKYLRPLLVLQQILIVPCVAAIPIIANKCKKEIIFISFIPIAFTLMNMPFHGLPRYVYPSIPFVLILSGVFLDKIGGLLQQHKENPVVQETYIYRWQNIVDLWMRKFYFVFAIIFSLVLLYSVYVFAYSINKEMSEYRLSRYLGITPQSLKSNNIITSREYKTTTDILIENTSLSVKNGKKVYKNDVDAPVIIKIKDRLTEGFENRKIVTEVNLNTQGGYLFDYMTVYWTGRKTPRITENCVYRFPINPAQQTHKIYIDDDVESLMVVPANFRGGKFRMDSINIIKYQINE